jgi:hypothetical protein
MALVDHSRTTRIQQLAAATSHLEAIVEVEALVRHLQR